MRIRNRYLCLLIAAVIAAVTVLPSEPVQAAAKYVKITSQVVNYQDIPAGTYKSLGIKVNTKSAVTYKSGNTKIASVKNGRVYANSPGRAKITVKAVPKSKSYKTTYRYIYVDVVPKAPVITSAVRKNHEITVSVNSIKSADGYQYEWAKSSNLSWMADVMSSRTACTFDVRGDNTYYFRVRSYAKRDGKLYFSRWSSVKKVVHNHNWERMEEGTTGAWENHPDENGNTTNYYLAEDSKGKKVGIYVCASCYKFHGGADSDIWISRYWDHDDKTGHGGYSGAHLYAVYELFYCEECGWFKRGDFLFYGYHDYSEEYPEWIRLTPEQVEELDLPLRREV